MHSELEPNDIFLPAGEEPPVDEHEGLDPRIKRFLDVPIEVRIELDRKKITLAQALSFREKMVVQLDRSAGENVDLLLDGLPVANGEIIVIEDMMGVRLTDLHRLPREDAE
ncbi:MAG: hypothetical protein GC160_28765 [Acidobacteria bacterium]|nr:hypothetical protein [Acidobacteriota bacterium]